MAEDRTPQSSLLTTAPDEEAARVTYALVERHPEPVSYFGLDGTIRYVNAATEQLWARPRAELYGKNLFDIFPDQRGGEFHRLFLEVARSGETRRFEYGYGARWYANSLLRVGERVCVFATDITEHRRLEEEAKALAEERKLLLQREHGARLQAEAERRRYHDLFMEMPAAFALMSGPELRYELSNPINTHLAGRELLGRTVHEAFPEFAEQGIIEQIESVYRTGAAYRYQDSPALLKMPDGSVETRYFTGVQQPTRDPSGAIDGIAAFAFDVTDSVVARQRLELLTSELERQQRAAQAGQEQFRRLFESGVMGVIFTDFAGKVLDANDTFLQLLGYTRADLEAGIHWRGLTPPDWKAASDKANAELETTGRASPFEKEYLRKDGVRVPVLIGSTRVVALGHNVTFVIDMTERRRVERALAESEARFRNMADSVPVMLWVTDAEGQCTYLNRQWFDFTGQREEEALGLGWVEAVHPDDQASARDSFLDAHVRRSPWRVEYRLRRADGEFRWAIDSAVPRFGPGGEYLGYVGSVIDIQERRLIEEERGRLLKEAQEAVRVRDEFLSVASHELKTPLTPLSLKLQSLAREAAKTPESPLAQKVLAATETGRQQVRKLSALIGDLLDVSRIAEGRFRLEREEVELSTLVREVVARHEAQALVGGSALQLFAERGVTGVWDRARIEQVVTNLVDNAIKYGRGQPIEVRVHATDRAAVLRVRDHGIGISPEDQTRIFGRFERAVSDRHYGGLGLGLYICRTIVENLGGEITVSSTPGEGASFEVILPLKPVPSRPDQG